MTVKTLTLVLAGVLAVGLFSRSNAAQLKVGDLAPDFELKGSDGKMYKLSKLREKQAVVVAWYPKAATPG